MDKSRVCCCNGQICGEVAVDASKFCVEMGKWIYAKVKYPFLCGPRVHVIDMSKTFLCGRWNKTIDWDKQKCLFQIFKDPFFYLKDPRIHVEIKDDYIDMFGLRNRVIFEPTLRKVVDTPGLVDERRDYRFSKPMDWGATGKVAVALRNTVYVIKGDDPKAKRKRLVTVGSGGGPGEGPITGVAWAPGGQCIALGFNDSGASVINLWDSVVEQWLGRSLIAGVGQHTAMGWNWVERNVLTYGDTDGNILCWDTRAPLCSLSGPVLRSCQGGHKREVTALRWSTCGDRLASGDKDGVVCIWDIRLGGRWIHSFHEESGRGSAAVKSLCWYPVHTHDLAVCRGTRVSFLNTNNHASFAELDTGYELSGLAWAENEKHFLTTHSMSGQGEGLAYWNHKGLARTFIRTPRCSDVLFMAQSPDPSMLALGLVDNDTREERVEIWKLFAGKNKCP